MTADGAAPSACPRCRQPLERAELRKVPVEACKGCKGTFVAQIDLTRLLESLSAALHSFDPEAEIEKVADANDRIDCPRCAKPMDRDDYCAAGVVFFDRCNSCQRLWFDADELGAMALLWGRMNARVEQVRTLNRQARAVVTFVNRGFLGSAVWTGLLFW
ncbi:MAG TPA: zf-TFIIB domain-containing protein [Polyangia bacterium]|nr:zf-TFIIB domain-containing protein [Polyangia bacterium]